MSTNPPMSIDARRAAGAVRSSVGAMTTDDEIDRAAAGLIAAWHVLADR